MTKLLNYKYIHHRNPKAIMNICQTCRDAYFRNTPFPLGCIFYLINYFVNAKP